MFSKDEIQAYVVAHQDETLALAKDLCAIPAPLNGERARAEYCLDWLRKSGGDAAYIDGAENVILPFSGTQSDDLTVFCAHTDTVFPDSTPYPWQEENGIIRCPSVVDDTANLAVVLIGAKFLLQSGKKPSGSILFVANSGEEGLGNLKGTRQLFSDFGKRIKAFISADHPQFTEIIHSAVGSHRYKISVDTEGGHSFSAFGNRNAIHVLSSLICSLYTVKVPVIGNSRTTYNVGTISGGTTVNTIAAHGEMLYEYRSDTMECMEKMKTMLYAMLDAYRAAGVSITCELIGDRPGNGPVDATEQQALCNRISGIYEEVLGTPCRLISGSTDANIPLSLGVPAVTIGLCRGGNCHTREEWLDPQSLSDGLRVFFEILNSFC